MAGGRGTGEHGARRCTPAGLGFRGTHLQTCYPTHCSAVDPSAHNLFTYEKIRRTPAVLFVAQEAFGARSESDCGSTRNVRIRSRIWDPQRIVRCNLVQRKLANGNLFHLDEGRSSCTTTRSRGPVITGWTGVKLLYLVDPDSSVIN